MEPMGRSLELRVYRDFLLLELLGRVQRSKGVSGLGFWGSGVVDTIRGFVSCCMFGVVFFGMSFAV